jgi:hypothetical protein
VIAVALAVALAAAARADTPPLRALGLSISWLEAHEPDPRTARLGNICLDAWAWYLLATLHPEAAVRTRAGAQVDRRLRALDPPTEGTAVALSYWATLMRLLDRRGIDPARYRTALSRFDLSAALDESSPTTRWWTAEFLRRSGLPIQPDFTSTFIATAAASSGAAITPTRRDAYRVFHEIVPATDLGHEPLTPLTPAQATFARGVIPGLLDVSRSEGDTDAVAEVLVSAALLGQRDTPTYRDGIAWLLTRQRADGTYESARDSASTATPDNFRHVVLVASWAVLTSLAR